MVKDLAKHYDTMNTYANPSSDHLLKTIEDTIILEETQANTYHNFFAKALFSVNRARPYIHTALAFLSMRVRAPDEDAWNKLARIMKYLCGTPKILLTLRAYITNNFKWWVDGYHVVHPNCRGHTGATQSL